MDVALIKGSCSYQTITLHVQIIAHLLQEQYQG